MKKALVWIVPAAAAALSLAVLLHTGQRAPVPAGANDPASDRIPLNAGSAPIRVTKTQAMAPSQPADSATAEDHAKIKVLDEILASKNDNDPRLDRDFNNLTPAAKALMKQRYHSLAREKLNERGTVLFLVGRNLSSTADFDFLKGVIDEPPCLSLADCSAEPKSERNSHLDGINQVTLAYPPLVALKSIENFLASAPKTHPDSALLESAYRTLAEARRSPISRVVALALEISGRYPQSR